MKKRCIGFAVLVLVCALILCGCSGKKDETAWSFAQAKKLTARLAENMAVLAPLHTQDAQILDFCMNAAQIYDADSPLEAWQIRLPGAEMLVRMDAEYASEYAALSSAGRRKFESQMSAILSTAFINQYGATVVAASAIGAYGDIYPDMDEFAARILVLRYPTCCVVVSFDSVGGGIVSAMARIAPASLCEDMGLYNPASGDAFLEGLLEMGLWPERIK